jgi:hypothetical protein
VAYELRIDYVTLISGCGSRNLYLLFLTLFKALIPADAQFFKKIVPKGEKFSDGWKNLPGNLNFCPDFYIGFRGSLSF